MKDFLFYLFGNACVAWILSPWLIKRQPNRLLIKCSACGAKLYMNPTTKRWWWADMMAWVLVAWFTVWRAAPHVSSVITLVMFFTSLFVWNMAVTRLVHAYFMWRHPIRCQGGGHFVPQPQGSS